MRTLFFTLRKTKPFNNQNLSISTHYGSRITVVPGRVVPVPVLEEDTKLDGELINWYNVRYSRMGLITSIKNSENVSVNDVPVKTIEKQLVTEVPDLSKVTPILEETHECESCKIESNEAVSESVESVESTKLEKSESVDAYVDVNSMSYPEMIKFCKDHGIVVEGRAKELYVNAIIDFLKK